MGYQISSFRKRLLLYITYRILSCRDRKVVSEWGTLTAIGQGCGIEVETLSLKIGQSTEFETGSKVKC